MGTPIHRLASKLSPPPVTMACRWGWKSKLAGPGVQHQGKAELRAEALGVGSEGVQGFGDRAEQQIEQDAAVCEDHRAQQRGRVKTRWKYAVLSSRCCAARSSDTAPAPDRSGSGGSGTSCRAGPPCRSRRSGRDARPGPRCGSVRDRPEPVPVRRRDRSCADTPRQSAEDLRDLKLRTRWSGARCIRRWRFGSGAAIASSGERVLAIVRVLTCT